MKDGSLHTLIELSVFLDHCDHFLLTAGIFAYLSGWKSTCSLIQAAVCCLVEEQDILDESRYIIEEEDDYFPPNISLVEPCKG